MERPVRIQRKRTKGWKLPKNTIYVGRPSLWGNPFTGDDAVEKYEEAISGSCLAETYMVLETWFANHGWQGGVPIGHGMSSWLRGKNLACWCPLTKKCHADILLKLSNA